MLIIVTNKGLVAWTLKHPLRRIQLNPFLCKGYSPWQKCGKKDLPQNDQEGEHPSKSLHLSGQ